MLKFNNPKHNVYKVLDYVLSCKILTFNEALNG
jgi:hypothetical protein